MLTTPPPPPTRTTTTTTRTMRAGNSWINPSPSSVMTPRNGASTSAVLPTKMALSDSKPKLQRETSETRQLSESALLDKENLTVPAAATDLWPFTPEQFHVSSSNSVHFSSRDGHGNISLINHTNNDQQNPSPLTVSPSPRSRSIQTSTTTPPTPPPVSNSPSTTGVGQSFWLNFLEDRTEPSNDGDAPTCFTPLGQLIQRTSTSGSPLSDASAYDTQEQVDEAKVDPLPNDIPPSTSSIQPSEEAARSRNNESNDDEAAHTQNYESSQDAAHSQINDSKEHTPTDVLSPVQAARLLFEQRAQQATTLQKWKRNSQPGLPRKIASSFQTPVKNNKGHMERINTVRETMASPNVSRVESQPPTSFIPDTPDSIIEIRGSISSTTNVSSSEKNLSCDRVNHDHKSSTRNDIIPDIANNNNDNNEYDKNDIRAEETSTPEEQLTPFQRARRSFSRHEPNSAQKTPPTFHRTAPMSAKQGKHNIPAVNNSSAKTKPPLSPPPKENNDSEQPFHQLLKAWRGKLDVRVNSQDHSGEAIHTSARTTAHLKAVDPANASTDADLSAASLNGMVHASCSNDESTHCFESDKIEESLDESEENSRALVILEHNNAVQIMIGDSNANDASHDELKIRNVEVVPFMENNHIIDERPCECSGSVFSGNDDLVSFFLPQMGMACTCGRISTGFVNPYEPTSLENVLRPWQVEFLNSFGIHRGEQLVKARHRSGAILARALKQWRKKHDMLYFKKSSCAIAIDIWAKTCKLFVRSIRKQISAGQDILESTPHQVMKELVSFVDDLPPAPKKMNHDDFILENIELESQVEV